MFTVVRLAYNASLEEACALAGITVSQVRLVQKAGEKIDLAKMPDDFRIISFDGHQMTISERVGGVRQVRGFAVGEQFGAQEPGLPRPQ